MYISKKICKNCGKEFETWIEIDGIKRNLKSRKFCLECSPFGKHNTKSNIVNIVNIGNIGNIVNTLDYGRCKNCNKVLKAYGRVYCNQKCKYEFAYKNYIRRWKNHEVDGTKGNFGQISEYVRRYIFEKYDSKCTKCGWSQVNPYTNTIPLEIDHIDGNWENSYEDNLDLLCPNCHSLTKTYRGANRGNGRNITWVIKDK